MKIIDMIAFILLIIGGLNWGLVGLVNFNLVDLIVGGTGIDRGTEEENIELLVKLGELCCSKHDYVLRIAVLNFIERKSREAMLDIMYTTKELRKLWEENPAAKRKIKEALIKKKTPKILGNRDFSELYKKNIPLPDVTFKFESTEKVLKGHRIVVAKSPLLDKLQENVDEIVIENLPKEAFERVLEFMYTSKIQFITSEQYRIIHEYGKDYLSEPLFNYLKIASSEALGNSITEENAFDVWRVAKECSDDALTKEIQLYIDSALKDKKNPPKWTEKKKESYSSSHKILELE